MVGESTLVRFAVANGSGGCFGTITARRHRALPGVAPDVPTRDVSGTFHEIAHTDAGGRPTVHFERRRVALRWWIDPPWASKLFGELHLIVVWVFGHDGGGIKGN